MKYLYLIPLLTACSTTYTLRHQPSEGHFFRNGREFVRQEVQGGQVELAFEELRSEDWASFKVMVKNTSDQPFEMVPSRVACGLGVRDPEEMLANIKERESELEPSLADVSLRALNSASLLASSFSNSPERKKIRAQAEAEEQKYVKKEEERKAAREQLRVEGTYWREQALRRTTLSKGEAVSGDVVCRLPEDPSNLKVSVVLPGGTADFPFQRVEL